MPTIGAFPRSDAQVMARSTILFQRVALLSLIGAGLLLAGCASTPPPTDAMDQAAAMLASARAAQAPIFAPLDLGAAEARYAQAQQALAGKHYGRASRLAAESEASAELARAKARLGQLRLQISQETRRNADLSSRLLGSQASPPIPAPPAPSGGTQTYPASASSSGGGR